MGRSQEQPPPIPESLAACRPYLDRYARWQRPIVELALAGKTIPQITAALTKSAAAVYVALSGARKLARLWRAGSQVPGPVGPIGRRPRACRICGSTEHDARNHRRVTVAPAPTPPPPPVVNLRAIRDSDEPLPMSLAERIHDRAASATGRVHGKSICKPKLTRDERALAEIIEYPDVDRPTTRGDCATMPRPCPFVSCSHHLYLDVNPETGSMKLNFPHLEVWEMAETCSLDVADRGGITLEEVGAILNVTRERVRQIEVMGLRGIGGRAELGTPHERTDYTDHRAQAKPAAE